MKKFYENNKEFIWMGVALVVVVTCFILVFKSFNGGNNSTEKQVEVDLETVSNGIGEVNQKVDTLIQIGIQEMDRNDSLESVIKLLQDDNILLLNKFRDTRHESRRQIELLLDLNQELKEENNDLRKQAGKFKKYD